MLNKTLAQIGDEITGTLREECGVCDPVLNLELDFETLGKCNYVYIPDFKRYYFVVNIVCIRNSLYRVFLHVDVLQTYAEQIKAQRAIIQRQENNWNLYLNDGFFRVEQKPKLQIKNFPVGFPAPSEYTWVLVTA